MASVLSNSSDFNTVGTRPKSTAAQVVKVFRQLDSAGLILDSFWSASGLQALKETPELLPLVYKKLTSDRPPQLAGLGGTPSAQAMEYIKHVLQSYAKDKTNRRNLDDRAGNSSLVKLIFAGNGYSTGSLNTLVRVANRIAGSYPGSQSTPDTLGVFRELVIDMRRGVISAVPEAFARTLAATRNPNAPIEVRRAQLMRDVAQVEVVANLCRAERQERIACALASLVLNQPERPASERTAAHSRLINAEELNGTVIDLAEGWA
jgi:hypothetical protein